MGCVKDCGSITCKAVRWQIKFCFKKAVYKIIFVTESNNYILELIVTLFRLIKFEISLVQAQVEAKIKDPQRKNKEQAFFSRWYWNEHSQPNFCGEEQMLTETFKNLLLFENSSLWLCSNIMHWQTNKTHLSSITLCIYPLVKMPT